MSFALIFAGCSSDSGNSESGLPFVGSGGGSTSSSSSSGVTLEFTEGNPPSEMFMGSPVNFAFVFKNFQQHNVDDLELKVSGFDTGYVSGLNSDYSISNIPRYAEATGAGVYAGLVASGVTVDGFIGNYNFNPRFDYCYTAKTTFRETVCVPSLTNQCEVDYDAETTQNGPVKMTINKINSISGNVQVIFNIENTGSGETRNTCFKEDDYATSYLINSIKLGTQDGNCQPQGTDDFLLGDGKGSFFCEFSRSQDSSYSTQLTAEIEYLYEQTLQKEFEVIDPTQ